MQGNDGLKRVYVDEAADAEEAGRIVEDDEATGCWWATEAVAVAAAANDRAEDDVASCFNAGTASRRRLWRRDDCMAGWRRGGRDCRVTEAAGKGLAASDREGRGRERAVVAMGDSDGARRAKACRGRGRARRAGELT
jgi:hypothetical protein